MISSRIVLIGLLLALAVLLESLTVGGVAMLRSAAQVHPMTIESGGWRYITVVMAIAIARAQVEGAIAITLVACSVVYAIVMTKARLALIDARANARNAANG